MASLEFTIEAGVTGKYDRLIDAKMQLLHGSADAAGEARLVPLMQFSLRIPFEVGCNMAKWALAPMDKGRFAKVTLRMTNRDTGETHTWGLQKAYVHRFEEIALPADAQNATSQENMMLVVIRGLVANGEDYNGENVLTMTSVNSNAVTPSMPDDIAPSALPSASASGEPPAPTVAFAAIAARPIPYALENMEPSVASLVMSGGVTATAGVERIDEAAVANGRATEYNLAPHGSQPRPRGEFQSHHIIQDEWAKENLSHLGYSSQTAPTILLRRGNNSHSIVTTLQNARRDARLAAGEGKWSTTLEEEFRNVEQDLQAAGVPDEIRNRAIEDARTYFRGLGAN